MSDPDVSPGPATAPIPVLDARPPVAAWRRAVFAGFLLSGLAVATWTSRIPVVQAELHLGVAQVGALITAVPIGSLVGVLLASHVLHRFGARTTVRTAAAGMAVAVAGLGAAASVAHSAPLAACALVLFGLSNSTTVIAVNVEAAALERAHGRTMLPLFHATWSIGGFVGAGLGAAASAAGVPLAVHDGVVAAAVLVTGLLLAPSLPRRVELAGRPAMGALDRLLVWREPRVLGIALVVLGFAFIEGAANNWLAVGMVEARGVSAAVGALMLSVFTLSMTVGRALGGRVVDRLGRMRSVRLSMLAAVLGILVVVLVPWPAIAVAGVVVWGLGAALGYPLSMSAAADDPDGAPARVAAVATVGTVAQLGGPSIIGGLGSVVGVLHAFLLPMAILATASLTTPALRPPAGSTAASVTAPRRA
ncbi:MFS transporter [Galbitalea sp. SE-J8]|uniref:MFS transporter n=1 Tax=Galbitalea sp. SE-J8 TaxID=3054952 RepID=UPI00259D1817|nr:MFS transporter [Galbitalea sp. SE-J8]MDM4763304.1 MFS transporter [Galbitalea sp. SE-J8]